MAGYLGIDASDEKPYIFISYNTEDQIRIKRIATSLCNKKINIWYDYGIERISEMEWQEQIALHIREAEIVIFFISKGIFDKNSSFVRKEFDLAKRHNKYLCVVLLDLISYDMVPPKYDFWWDDIMKIQSIEAYKMTEEQCAQELYNECIKHGFDSINQMGQAKEYVLVSMTDLTVVGILNLGIHSIGRRSPGKEIKQGEIYLDDFSVSRIHALIKVSEHEVTIRDMKSMNGTIVNGHMLTQNEEKKLNSGDAILIGNTTYKILCANEIERERLNL